MKKYRIIFGVVIAVLVLGIAALWLNPLVEDEPGTFTYTQYGRIGGRYTMYGIIEGSRGSTIAGDIFLIATLVILGLAALIGLSWFLYKKIRPLVFRIRGKKDTMNYAADTDEIYYHLNPSNKEMMNRQIELHSIFPYGNKEKSGTDTENSKKGSE